MSKFLIILSLVLRLIARYIELFESGWRIELYAIYSHGHTELKLVRHWWSRLFRGIRYVRGLEGVPVPKCGDCDQPESAHEMCCPEPELSPEEVIALLKAQGVIGDKAGTVREDVAPEEDQSVGEETEAPGAKDSSDPGAG